MFFALDVNSLKNPFLSFWVILKNLSGSCKRPQENAKFQLIRFEELRFHDGLVSTVALKELRHC